MWLLFEFYLSTDIDNIKKRHLYEVIAAMKAQREGQNHVKN